MRGTRQARVGAGNKSLRRRAATAAMLAGRLTADAVAHVAGSSVTFGGGESHPAGQAGTKQSAVILRYGG